MGRQSKALVIFTTSLCLLFFALHCRALKKGGDQAGDDAMWDGVALCRSDPV